MKKIYIYLILPVLLAFCLSACSDNAEPVVPAIELQGGNTLNTDAKGGLLNLEFHSTFPWTATSDEAWCLLNKKSGEAGNITLAMDVKPNEMFESRRAVITLRSETVVCKVDVIQTEHGMVTLVVNHTLPTFTLPEFTGTGITGSVQWGDGTTEEYQSDLSHDFTDEKEHATSISLKGVETVIINNVKGITEIDFSLF